MTTSDTRRMKEQHGPGESGPQVIRFGNYDLVRRIDVGGMGEVYLARQRTAFGREVAVKIIRSDLVHDILARRRFLREAEVSAHLKHEHILPLFEFGEEQGRLFLVTPYIEGGTLATRLQSGALPLSEIYQLFTALVQAISYIHKRGVIHRDLKPSNILLDKESDTDQVYVRLIDFGIASIQGLLASEPLTKAGHEMGTLAYLAPERLSGIAAPSNDIYSLGIILYEMLTGHLPTPTRVARFPRSLEYIIHRCIAPHPEARFATADELLRAFDLAYTELTNGGPRVTAPVHVVHARPTPPINEGIRNSGVNLSMENPPAVESGAIAHDAPTPRRTATQPPLPVEAVQAPVSGALENRVLPREVPIPVRPEPQSFRSEDYGAPTTFIAPSKTKATRVATVLPGVPDQTPPKRSKRSLVGIISTFTVITLLVLAGVFYFTFQSVIFTTADITVTPSVQPISKVFTLSAKSGLQSADLTSASIPLNSLTPPISQTKSETGPTTGKQLFCFFACAKAVSSDDVYKLATKIRQELMNSLTQQVQAKLQALNATQIGDIQFAYVDGTSQPNVGDTSDTVTVTLTGQATVKYISNSDAKNMATSLLQKQVTQGYTMLPQMQSGQPVFIGLNGNGVATIKVAAAGAQLYQLQDSMLETIQAHIKGMKERDALAYIAQQPGIDAKSIQIRISSGDTLPSDSKQIKVTKASPVTPSLQLTAVPIPTASPTATAGATG